MKWLSATFVLAAAMSGSGFAAQAQEGETITNSIGMKLKRIPAGTFMMGSGKDAHEVKLTKPLMLGVCEVTQEQFERVMGKNPSQFKCHQAL